MSNYIVNSDDLGTVADAIRQKSGSSETMTFPEGFKSQIQSIPTGSGGGFTPTVLMCTVNIDPSQDTGPEFQTTTTLTAGTYAEAKAAIEAGTPAVLKITLQATVNEEAATMLVIDVFLSFSEALNDFLSGSASMFSMDVYAIVQSDGLVQMRLYAAERESDVFYIDVDADPLTFELSNWSHSYSDVSSAVSAGRLVKIRIETGTASVYGDLQATESGQAHCFGTLAVFDLGAGNQVCFFRIVYRADNTGYVDLYTVDATLTNGGT